MTYNLTGFSEVRIFLLFFGNDIIMTSFLPHGFQTSIFCELRIGYRPAKFLSSRLSGSSFTEGLEKHVMMSFHIVGV